MENMQNEAGFMRRTMDRVVDMYDTAKRNIGKVTLVAALGIGAGAAVESTVDNNPPKVEAGTDTPCNPVIGNCTPDGTDIVETPDGELIELPTGIDYEPKDATTTTEEETTTTVEETTTTKPEETTTTVEETTTTKPEDTTTTTSTTSTTTTSTTVAPTTTTSTTSTTSTTAPTTTVAPTTSTTTPGVRPPVNSQAPTN